MCKDENYSKIQSKEEKVKIVVKMPILKLYLAQKENRISFRFKIPHLKIIWKHERDTEIPAIQEVFNIILNLNINVSLNLPFQQDETPQNVLNY